MLCLVLSSSALWAGSTGKISGTIRDSRTKEALPGVNVVVQGTSLGASSDVSGKYVILNVPPGRHKVVASFIGYRRFEVTDLSVSVDFTTPLDIDMVEGSVELDAVVIQAERSPLIRQDLTNPVASISSDAIDALPVTDITEVVGLQAGVTVDDDGSLHVRGGQGNEIAYTLNGININNPMATHERWASPPMRSAKSQSPAGHSAPNMAARSAALSIMSPKTVDHDGREA